MQQRFTLDRSSFEQFLCATSLIQTLQAQLGKTASLRDPRQLNDLVDTQLAIENEALDFQTLADRVVSFALKLRNATGAGLWLLVNGHLVKQAGAGLDIGDDRLQFEVLAKLRNDTQVFDPRNANCSVSPEWTYHPGSLKSLLVVPVYQARNIAGALAVLSMQFDAFTEHDATQLTLYSGLITRALAKAAEAEFKKTVTEERTALLKAIDQIIPALTLLADKKTRNSAGRSSAAQRPAIGVDSYRGVQGPIARALAYSSAQSRGPSATKPDSAAASQSPGTVRSERPVAFSGNSPELKRPVHIKSMTWGWMEHGASRLQILAQLATSYCYTEIAILGRFAKDQSQKVRPTVLRIAAGCRDISRAARSRVRVRIKAPPELMHRLRAMSTIPLLASSIVLAALFLALGEGNTSDQTAGASSTGISPEFVALTSALVKPAVGSVSRIAATGSQPSAQSLALLSHRVVTDPALAADLHSLSRYEIEALRRRAKFGDDSAALLLGMAYETGTYVPQDCRRAASLIAQAANAGSAAAQYNLGLRYRTGDGVPTDVQLGMQWLTKAASRNYAQAKHALQSKP